MKIEPTPNLRLVVRFEVFTAVTMKNGAFWVVTPCGSCKNPEDTILYDPLFFKIGSSLNRGFPGIRLEETKFVRHDKQQLEHI
jgi:hypothetical protein